MKKLLFVASLIFIGFSVQAQETKISTEVKNHIKARVDAGLNVGIAVGYFDEDGVEFFNYGKTAITNGADIDEHSVFEIGSISKTFTTIMLAEEVVNGTMNLSDPISQYLPEQVKVPTRNNRVITLKDLATHSSGLPRLPSNLTPANQGNPYADYTTEQAYEFMSGHELTRDIGSLFEYSNYAMGMLGHILELKHNKSYEDVMVDKIANVFGMNDTRVVFTTSMKERLARGHSGGREVENWDLPSLAGAGAIRSTTTDMIKFLQANVSDANTLIVKAMKLSHQEAYKNEEQNFEMGLGWHYAIDKKVVWHNGGTGGYVAFAGFLKGTKIGVVVLTNSTESVDALGLKILDDTRELAMPKMSIANDLGSEIDTNGIEAGLAFYKKAKSETPDKYQFNEGELNQLGYNYVNQDKLDIALAIFKLNVEMFPEASNPYDSLGEAYLKLGDSVLAKKNYSKSLELNPANDSAKKVLESLGVKAVAKEVNISQEVLDTYVGKYELAANFTVTITRKEKQLYLQATGQPQFEIFASAQNKFYLKVVEARVTFNADEAGEITSMTLYQGGQVVPGKKLE